MAENSILIITCQNDVHSDKVIETLYKKGHKNKVVRLNTEDFLENCEVCFNGFESQIFLKDSKRIIHTNYIKTVWYRRPSNVKLISKSDDEYINDYISLQAEGFLKGFYYQLHDSAKWINRLPEQNKAKHKLLQLQLAQKLDFNVPKTIVTNDRNEIMSFVDNQTKVCTKGFAESSLNKSGRVYPFLTQVINKDFVLRNLDSISICPTLLQEFIYKKFDIRIFILGEIIIAFEIHSQTQEETKNDFRGINPYKLKHTKHKLPNDIESKVYNFVKAQGLIFSSMDLVVDENDNYYFLENNPNGQWLWLEHLTGVKLCDIFADELLK